MRERLNRLWRICGTGVSFAAFGLGGLLLWLLAFPLLRLFVRDEDRRGLLARRVIRRSFAGHVGLMRALGVLSYELVGIERLRRPGLLILANHPTLIDVVFLVSLVEDADCVVRAGLAENPFTRGPVRATGYVRNHLGPGLVDDCIASVRAGRRLLIFPEGTRTPRGQLLGPLQRGAANIAVRGRLDMTPVLITCTPRTLGKGEKWYRVPPRRFHVRIEVLPDIPVAPFLAAGSEALAARRLTGYLDEFYKTELARVGAGT
ncbi:lysophospholipid acyltransferase family protein [Arenimonas fontis]|uniref:1-acyl-sn-glycerol-3-phosphate acyltransferase n=1 Tax=Arenimonas fontis TaxID=2608255 RepID=A0A5B2ZE86_9GAMM|nr:lysophospholipid acyltransferase family protein [Arenimonas fontis]KAA2285943.1 1-acyl-sn-glycerol-3-phosphate acyltransferase [Arenimonas fontis]